MTRTPHRQRSGVTLVEFAASMAFGLPLTIAMLYAVLEANYLFTIRTNLDIAVRQYAQAAITNYQTSGTQGSADAAGLAAVNIPHFVVPAASQFSTNWDLSTNPHTLTVYCTYPSGGSPANGLPPFPCPDPLGLGSSFVIRATGTFGVPPE